MPTSTAGRSNSQAGFTLIEIALVVVLLGLMAGLTMPMISGLEPDHLNASARRLAGTVKYLYNEAAMTGLEHRIVFDLDHGSYRTVKLSAGGEVQEMKGVAASHKLGAGVRFEAIYQPRHGEFHDGKVTMSILPGGWIDETILHLSNEDKRKLTLRLVPLTGLTEIYDGYRDFRK